MICYPLGGEAGAAADLGAAASNDMINGIQHNDNLCKYI